MYLRTDLQQIIDALETTQEAGLFIGYSIRWLVTRKTVQWGFCQTLGVALLLAPVQGRWSDMNTLYSRLAAIGCFALATQRGEKVLDAIELKRERNQTSQQIKMERIAHALQLDRTIRKRELRELGGVQPMDSLLSPSFDQESPGDGPTLDTHALPAAKAESPAPKFEDVKFDLHRLNPPRADRGKNILIIAGQDVGKTTLALYIAGEVLQSEDIQVYDLDDDGDTWGNLPVWGTGDDDSEIAGAMAADEDLFNQRTDDRVKGKRVSFSVRILDETPTVVQRIPKPFNEWSFMMTSRARKRGLIAVLLTQYRDPEMNGLKPDQMKTAFATIYLGWKQVNHALNYLVKPKADADKLRAALEGADRPALVYFDDGWYWYNVPDLQVWKDDFLAQTRQKVNPSSDTQLGLKPAPVPPKMQIDTAKLPAKAQEFFAYILDKKPHEKEWFNTRKVADNWGRHHFGSTEGFKEFLAHLITAGAVRSRDSDLGWFCLSAGLRELCGNADEH